MLLLLVIFSILFLGREYFSPDSNVSFSVRAPSSQFGVRFRIYFCAKTAWRNRCLVSEVEGISNFCYTLPETTYSYK
jgi:hypothetical protein